MKNKATNAPITFEEIIVKVMTNKMTELDIYAY